MRHYRVLPLLATLTVIFAGHLVKADEPGACPVDDGKYRTTSAGTFLITCYKRSGRGAMGPPNPETMATFAACIDACAARPRCMSVDYNADSSSCTYLGGSFVPGLASASGPMVHNARLATKPADPVAPPIQSPVQPPVEPPVQAPIQPPIAPPVQSPVVPSPDPSTGTGSGGVVYTQDAHCAEDDKKVYVASDGTNYMLQCNYQASRTLLSKTTAIDLKDCMEKCSAMNGCLSVQLKKRSPDSTATLGECSLFTKGDAATQRSESFDFAYAIDPPAQDSPDFPNQLCTTSCPYADGMIYTSSYGETFKMDCGKRHGTITLSMGYTETFTDCMENCAKIVACHSVDYQARTKKCYYGTHSGNPLIIASSFDSAHSMGCANACGGGCCGGNTKTPPEAPKLPTVADISCGNQGLAYGIFPNQYANGAQQTYNAPDYSAFDPTPFKTMSPQVTSVTTSLGFTDCSNIYGNTPTDYTFVTVNHRGYIFAEQSGEYTFSFPSCDNIVMFWLGPTAYTDYTRANANIVQPWVGGGATAVSYKTTLTQGNYYPIRIIFANGGGPGNMQMSITAPDGKVIVDSTTGPSNMLVQFSCDGVSAPKFPAIGAEASTPSLTATDACPGLDQQLRTVDGRLYKIFCGAYTTPGNQISSDQRSWMDCLKGCSANPQCQQVDFTGPVNMGTCWIKSGVEVGPTRLNQGPTAMSAYAWPPKKA